MPSDSCFLTPPANAGRAALESHLVMLRTMNEDDPLVRLAIEDTEALLAVRPPDD